MFGKRSGAPAALETARNDFENDGIPNVPLSPATLKHLEDLRERKILPAGRFENDPSNWRTYFGSLFSNITATVETPEEKQYKVEAGQDLQLVALYEVSLERVVQAINAIKLQVRNAPNFGRVAARVIEEEGARALATAIQKYQTTLATLKSEQIKVEGIYRRRMADNKAAAARAIEEGKRRAALFETDASAAETDLDSLQTRSGAILKRLGTVEKPKEIKD